MKRLYMVAGLVAIIALAVAGFSMVASNSAADTLSTVTGDENGPPENAGKLDDGADLQSQAGITLEQAISAAQGAANGSIGEIDLEYHDGKLVYNVDVGDQDVKVDAANGAILGSGSD